MAQKICVYTCITGDYDNLHEIEHPEKDIDYFCFTNNPNLKSKTWKIIQISDKKLDNCRLARKIKILGHEKVNSYDIAIWTDADIIWQTKVSDFIKTYLKDAPFAVFKHYCRTTVHDEAGACLFHRKDSPEKIADTLKFLESEQFPDNLGLYETTVFIKKPQDPTVIKTMELWFDLIQKYSRRDQLSLPYAVWKTHLKISLIDLVVWDNSWFSCQPHNSKGGDFVSSTKTCGTYYGDPERNFNFSHFFLIPFSRNRDTFQISHQIPCNTKEIYLTISSYVGIKFDNVQLTPKPTTTTFINDFDYKNEHFFFSNFSAIKFSGHFKKGQKLSFSIDLHPLNHIQATDLFFSAASELAQLESINAKLTKQNTELVQQNADLANILHSIENSRSYRLIRRLRGIPPK